MNTRALIYKGIIQYLLDNANYSLHNIASLSDTPLKHIRTIYKHNQIPKEFSSDVELVRLFQMVLEMNVRNHCLYGCPLRGFINENIEY